MSFKSGVKAPGSDRWWERRWWLWWGRLLSFPNSRPLTACRKWSGKGQV